MNKRYAVALAIAAGCILVAGALFRPKPPKQKPAEPVAAENAPVRGTEMRQMSDFLSARAQTVAQHLVWVASARATGVQWTDGQIVTVGTAPAIVRTATVTTSAPPRPVGLVPLTRFEQGGWVVVAARSQEGGLVTASGLLGGVTPAQCGTESVRRLLFNIPLESAYAGAGVFGMSGNLLGLVVPCGEGWGAITHDTVERLLHRQLGPEAVTWSEFGVRFRDPSDAERKVLRLPERGLFVGEVRRGSQADIMGLLPGDKLLMNGPEDLRSDLTTIDVVRNGRTTTLSVQPPFSLESSGGVAVLKSVQPDTELAKAGLQPGDRIVNADVLKSRRPAWLIYIRDDRQIGVLLP